jgi:hypothetical protein
MEKQLHEALYAINRAIGEAVDDGVTEDYIGELEDARAKVWHVGEVLYNWNDDYANNRGEDRVFDGDGNVLGRFPTGLEQLLKEEEEIARRISSLASPAETYRYEPYATYAGQNDLYRCRSCDVVVWNTSLHDKTAHATEELVNRARTLGNRNRLFNVV